MSGENNIVGLWRDRDGTAGKPIEIEQHVIDSSETGRDMVGTVAEPEAEWIDEEAPPGGRWRRPLALGACLLGSAAWVGVLGYTQYVALAGRAITLSDIVQLIATASAPLALAGVAWLALMRTSRREAHRYARTIEDLHKEGERLELTLTHVSERIRASRNALAMQTDSLSGLGEEAAVRLNSVGESMRGEIETIGRHTVALKNSAAAARADMAVLLSDLPKAQVQTQQMVASLQEAGLNAHTQAGSLEAQLSALVARGREADEIAGGAAERLAAHLSRMEGVSETAGARLEEAAGQMTSAVDAALERAALALSAAREGMEAQGAAMRALVEQSQAALQSAGADSSDALSQRVAAISERAEKMAEIFAQQDSASQEMFARITRDIDDIGARFATIGAQGTTRVDELASAIDKLRTSNDALQLSLNAGGKSATTLIERAETLLTALDASARELEDNLPDAYDRLAEKAEASIAAAQGAGPAIDAIEKKAAATLDRLMEAEGLLARQRTALEGLVNEAGGSLNISRDAVEALSQSIDDAEARAKSLTESAGPKLVAALLQVKETAAQAAERSREAFADIIPQTAATLSAKTKEALEAAITRQVEDKLVEVAQNAENAVMAAQKATDRLMRQMLTIAETSAALEARFAEAKEEVEEADQSAFSRRIALLIESLNSTAIDVTKILSNDVTDIAWASYLKGDRGVFTRRAVRLLDTNELREIQRHYDNAPEFRDHVNRYIHDFEAMLRQVLSSREGSAISVTLLSSDAGKLYVALAQAIERLRT
jgi:hypothetical protein